MATIENIRFFFSCYDEADVVNDFWDACWMAEPENEALEARADQAYAKVVGQLDVLARKIADFTKGRLDYTDARQLVIYNRDKMRSLFA